VHGNVWDWTEDCWHDTYQGAPTDGSARTRMCFDGRRVVRVVPGSSIHGSFAPPTAAGGMPSTGTATGVPGSQNFKSLTVVVVRNALARSGPVSGMARGHNSRPSLCYSRDSWTRRCSSW
jgi:formylglycine-generating enzyme required for sulfatase activity